MAFDFPLAKDAVAALKSWMAADSLLIAGIAQAIAILLALALGLLASLPLRRRLAALVAAHAPANRLFARLVHAAVDLIPLLGMLTALLILSALSGDYFARKAMIEGAAALMGAFVAARALHALMPNKLAAQCISLLIWLLVVLNVLGLGGPLAAYIDGVSVTFGKARISVLTLLKASTLFVLLFMAAGWASNLVQSKLQKSRDLTPSAQTLISQSLKAILLAAAIFIPLNSMGIDLSALAVFSGALGVGLGFGLQKTAGNFISGVILLLDKSIKPGDVIEVGGVYGWITGIHGRYSSVLTRSGTHYLIPNEELITKQVINWSYSGGGVRLQAGVGVSYNADLRLAMRLMEEAGRETKRVRESPPPVVRLLGFGDNTVNLELRFWINDPQNGVANVKSQIFLSIWDKFKANGIDLPFPQRDVHLNMKDACSSEALRESLARMTAQEPDPSN